MTITIEPATSNDINVVQKFGHKLLNYEREAFDPTLQSDWAFSDEAKKKYLSAINEHYVVIAKKDGQPVGFLIGRIIPSQSTARNIKRANLENIFVDPDERGKGVGEKLIGSFKSYCQKHSVTRLDVSVLAQNQSAIDFYKKVGFNPRSINLSQKL